MNVIDIRRIIKAEAEAVLARSIPQEKQSRRMALAMDIAHACADKLIGADVVTVTERSEP